MRPRILWLLAKRVLRLWVLLNGKLRHRQCSCDKTAHRKWFLRKMWGEREEEKDRERGERAHSRWKLQSVKSPSHPICHILFIRNVSLSSAHTSKGRELTFNSWKKGYQRTCEHIFFNPPKYIYCFSHYYPMKFSTMFYWDIFHVLYIIIKTNCILHILT